MEVDEGRLRADTRFIQARQGSSPHGRDAPQGGSGRAASRARRPERAGAQKPPLTNFSTLGHRLDLDTTTR
jgi:hypothetical protein